MPNNTMLVKLNMKIISKKILEYRKIFFQHNHLPINGVTVKRTTPIFKTSSFEILVGVSTRWGFNLDITNWIQISLYALS